MQPFRLSSFFNNFYFFGDVNFGVVFSLILGWFLAHFGGRFLSFCGQVVSKMEFKIDDENGVEKSWKKGGPSNLGIPGLVAKRG